MLGCLADPFGEVADRPGACPVLVFPCRGRIDDASDMAGAGHHVFDLAAEIFRTEEHRKRRRDVVLPRGQVVDWYSDIAERHGVASQFHQAARQIVLEIAVAQVEGMVGGRHAGRVVKIMREHNPAFEGV